MACTKQDGPDRNLMKPFEDTRFDLALGRAKEKLAQGKSLPRPHELLAIKSTGLISFGTIREIDWIDAADYYACLRLAGRTHLLRRSITDLERELDPNRFCGIHRSHRQSRAHPGTQGG